MFEEIANWTVELVYGFLPSIGIHCHCVDVLHVCSMLPDKGAVMNATATATSAISVRVSEFVCLTDTHTHSYYRLQTTDYRVTVTHSHITSHTVTVTQKQTQAHLCIPACAFVLDVSNFSCNRSSDESFATHAISHSSGFVNDFLFGSSLVTSPHSSENCFSWPIIATLAAFTSASAMFWAWWWSWQMMMMMMMMMMMKWWWWWWWWWT